MSGPALSQCILACTLYASMFQQPVGGQTFVPIPEGNLTAFSLDCNATGAISGGSLHQGIKCGRNADCRGFGGIPENGGVEMECTCMVEPGHGSNFTTTFTEQLRLIYSYTLFKAPDFFFPMDEMNGATLVGAIDGTVLNGATLVAGRFGNALYTNGSGQQYVTYGFQPTICYLYPHVCTVPGFTYSMWVRILRAGETSAIYSSGAYKGYKGIYLVYKLGDYFNAGVKTPSWKYKYTGKSGSVSAGIWLHLVITWAPQSLMQMFINGCEAGGSAESLQQVPINGNKPFNIGADDSNGNRAHMELDHLLIWTKAFTPDDIWHLYMQDGTV